LHDCLQGVEVVSQPEQVSMTQDSFNTLSQQNLPANVPSAEFSPMMSEAPRQNDSKNRNRKYSAAQVTL